MPLSVLYFARVTLEKDYPPRLPQIYFPKAFVYSIGSTGQIGSQSSSLLSAQVLPYLHELELLDQLLPELLELLLLDLELDRLPLDLPPPPLPPRYFIGLSDIEDYL